uniref:Alpha-1,2-mannosidase n=1 Tax=Lotharella globosa TaxID=91324 RepID=A0A7S3YSB0_9EUKA|mmetsp:Transcript_39086/g.75025  ORF Transcript_39086/g.75025 Transcript_39086/m.75025 type:complete len:924 (-) Transcript_39086:481-3252(-)
MPAFSVRPALLLAALIPAAAVDPEDYVDVLMGTRSRIDLSDGNVLPFIGRPWAMNLWAPQTNNYAPNAAGKAWWFHPDDRELYGIRCTHQPSPWINDYGNFLINSEIGPMWEQYPDKASSFHSVSYRPYQYDVQLDAHCDGLGNCLTINLTGTEHGAILKITFPPYDKDATGWDQTRRVWLMVGDNSTDAIDVNADAGTITGWTQANNGGVPKSHEPAPGASAADDDADDDQCESTMTVKKSVGYSGNDVYRFQVNDTDPDGAAKVCLQQCCADERCKAWTIDLPSGGGDRFNCSGAFPCCWIKSVAEDNGARGSHVSGYKKGFGPQTLVTHFHHYFHLETTPKASKAGIKQKVSDHLFDSGILGYLEFAPEVSEVTVRIATSFISPDMAKVALARELPANKSFEQVAMDSKKRWNEVLSTIDVTLPSDDSGDDLEIDLSAKEGVHVSTKRSQASEYAEARKKTLYSSMYRASLFPRSLAEIDGDGHVVHYSAYDEQGRTFPGEIAADSGFWDAYRTVYQLGALIHPEQYAKMIQGWMNAYREQGWLPGWPSPGERGAMAATMQDCVVADAIVRDMVPGLDLNEAYKAIAKDAFTVQPPGAKKGREGLDEYLKYGYLAADGKASDQVAASLNFMLCDYSISLAAAKLGRDDDAKALAQRAANWRKLFDRTATGGSHGVPGFFRPKLMNGTFESSFDVYAWGGLNHEYTEAAPYQYRFYVPHDPEGLAEAYGGGDVMCKALEEMMTTAPTYHLGSWGLHHEQVEMVEFCFGQYEHNNQPVHHVLYMFKGAGCPAQGQKWLRYAQDNLYNERVGYSGDEDNGEMSSWFVLSSLGLYQLVPGSEFYEIGSPTWETATVKVGDDKVLKINAPGNSPDTPYVKSVSFNGTPLNALRVKFSDLRQGGELQFEMTGDADEAQRFYEARRG